MAKDAGKKRKLEAVDNEVTPKRWKASNGEATATPVAKTNGEAAATPYVPSKASTVDSASKKAKKSGRKELAEEDATTEAQCDDATNDQPTSATTNGTTMKNTQRKKSKKRRSGLEEDEESPGEEIVVARRKSGQAIAAKDKTQRALEKKARRKAKREHSTKSLTRTADGNTSTWKLSSAGAGRFIDHDPIFVRDENDEESLIAATSQQVQLLSLETSLLVRAHNAPEGRSIICFARNPHATDAVDIAYDDGSKVTWNWITSEATPGTFPGQEVAFAMTTATIPGGSNELYYIAQSGSDYIVAGERRALHTTQRPLKSMQVLHEGAYIICRSATAVLIGARKEPVAQSEYTWVEVPSTVPIRCVEGRLVFKSPGKKQQSKRPGLALAIGNAEGQIHLYSDVSTAFGSPGKAALPDPRILHWHREAVSSVKFSRDGVYLISGGKETVLVIWQLDTGKRQFLPHLTAEIERIVVSPEGSKYALQMGDNSIMVVSTSELKPIANFAGLQLPLWNDELEAVEVVAAPSNAILHPKDPTQMLLSVPSTQPKEGRDIPTRPFLQAFDVRNSRHLWRQALTRNNVTDFNVGPDNTPVSPPDVRLLALSADGTWLATMDEWVQPGIDLEHLVSGALAEDIDHVRQQQESRYEICLKFWRWDQAQSLWTLSTRIDAPHSTTTTGGIVTGPGGISRMVSSPRGNSFATIGQDGNVRLWGPRTRTRHGVPLKEADGTDLIEWICIRTVPVPLPLNISTQADSPTAISEESEPITDSFLAFSPDGSMLACAQRPTDEASCTQIHFISTVTGTVVSSKSGLVPPEHNLIDLAFLDRYFICLTTDSVRTWDLVEDKHWQTRHLTGGEATQGEPMLAVNDTDGTFAVVWWAPVHATDEERPKIQVCDPRQHEALLETNLPAAPSRILAGSGAQGYTILFEDATIRTLVSAASNVDRQIAMALAVSTPELGTIEDAIEEDTEVAEVEQEFKPLALSSGEYSAASAALEDDRSVVRPEQLASIFDLGQSFAMPPVRDMFHSVVELFGRKPPISVQDDTMDVVHREA